MDAVTSSRSPVPVGPVVGVGVGVVAPYDFALDRELWRWAPEDVTLHLVRTAVLAAAGHRRAGRVPRRQGRGGAVHEGPDGRRAPGDGLRLHVGQLRGRARRRAGARGEHARRGRRGRGHHERRARRGADRPWRHQPGGGHPLRRRRDGAAARLPRGDRGAGHRVRAPRAVRAHLDRAVRRHRRARARRGRRRLRSRLRLVHEPADLRHRRAPRGRAGHPGPDGQPGHDVGLPAPHRTRSPSAPTRPWWRA